MERTDKDEIIAAIGQAAAKVDRLDDRIRALETEVAELKGEVRGEMRQMSARISDLYTRLPVQPPGKQRA